MFALFRAVRRRPISNATSARERSCDALEWSPLEWPIQTSKVARPFASLL